MNEDQTIRAALDRHWAASDANDFETEHEIYHDDAVLEYPQSGERIRGRRNIQYLRRRAGDTLKRRDLSWLPKSNKGYFAARRHWQSD